MCIRAIFLGFFLLGTRERLCVGVILFCFSHAEKMRGFYFAVDFSELWRTAGSQPLGVLVGSVVWQWSSASPGCPEFLLKGATGTSCRASTNLQQPSRTDGRTRALKGF